MWLLGLVPVRAEPADLVLRGGAVYKCDASRSWAEALAVGQGRLVYVGSPGGLQSWIGPSTRVLELQGKMVLPSFHDCHVHPVSSAVELSRCNLLGCKNAAEVMERVRAYASGHPDAPWILGTGWDLPLFPRGQPHRGQLDALVGDRPAFLTSADGHNAWVSSRALELAGITSEAPDPPGGRLERGEDGRPTGLLQESALALVQRHVPPPTAAEYLEAAQRGLDLAHRYGITTVHEADATREILEAYHALDRANRLGTRVIASLHFDPDRGLEQLPDLVRARQAFQGRRLHPRAVKLFADGVIESYTAAVLEPYVGRPQDHGILNYAPDRLEAIVEALDGEGFQIHIHAIGDRAIRSSLDALESARQIHGARDARHHIAHLQLIAPEDISRFRRLGVMANVQALWAYADPYITELTEPRLGLERSRWLYPFGSLARSGATLVGGSDWSVSSLNPLEAIEVGVTRQDPGRSESAPWLPEQRLELPDLLAAYTIQAAYLGFLEHETGSLEVGKAADLVVLDRNLFEIPATEIGQARVLLTVLEGEAVYQDPDWPGL